MSKLDELIAELCPDGVEYKAIQEISKNISSGGTPKTTRKDFYDGDIPWLRTQEVNFCDITDTGVKITKDGLENSSAKWIPENCVIVAMYGATVGKIGINKIPLTTNQACCNLEIDSNKALYKYVFYCLANQYEYIKSLGQGAQTNINAQIVKNLEIPVPPLPVQEEIVRILDKFTSYGDCLNKELSLRKKQYEWTRQKLLEIKKTPVVQIKDVCRIEKGKTPIQKAVPGEYPLVVTTDERKTCSTYQFDCKAVCLSLVSARGHGVAQISRIFYQEGKFALGNILCAIIPNNENQLSAKFLRHYLFYKKDSLLVPLMKGGANVALHVSDLEKVKFPLPPLDVQQRIVNVLDNFDAICSDLKIGLPAEIDARKKQYEYYRDLLLTFAERGNTIFTEQNRTEQNRTDEIKLLQYVFGYAIVRLGEIATEIYRGSGITRDQVTTDGISCVRYGEIYTTYGIWFDKCVSHTHLEDISSCKYFEHGDILFAITGESVEDIAKSTAYVGEEKCLAGGDIVVMKHKQNPKFLSYVLSTTDAQKQKGKGKVKSKVVHSSVPAISEITIPLPTLEEQERIVKILDRFEELVASTGSATGGIPAEIEARKKQYEYYRDKILNFRRK